MPIIGLSIIVQLICAVHCARNSRNYIWFMVIVLLSVPGCLAYAIFEILPGYAGRREVRSVKAAAIRKLDPERDLRAARDALELADTSANHIALGDALAAAGSHRDAIAPYRAALAKARGGDRATQIKLARAELETGDAASARDHLETLPESMSPSENDRAHLLLARALQECGENDRALAMFADVGHRLPGGEAQCRRAALLLTLGRKRDAQLALEEVEVLAKRLDKFERRQNKDMYDWASRTLGELRA